MCSVCEQVASKTEDGVTSDLLSGLVTYFKLAASLSHCCNDEVKLMFKLCHSLHHWGCAWLEYMS